MSHSSPAAASMDVPHTQNTAPVLEFRCLFTSDLRRKQKRWQDGRLKFHTFNKRIMVYDDRSNFVGDTHWRKDYEFEEGEEVELERGGILVEVAECIGKRDQDLTELIDKRVKDREERVTAKNAATPMRPRASVSTPQTPTASALLRPKSLNAVLGNPTRHYGKAVIPHESPFEQRRQAKRNENENGRPAKRRKQDNLPPSKYGYAQNLTGTMLNLSSSRPSSTVSIRYEPLRPTIERPPAVTIDLTEDGEEGSGKTKESRPVPKALRKKPNKSPARSGYASSLTGASLSLGGHEKLTSKRAVSSLELGMTSYGRFSAMNQCSAFSSVEADSMMEDAPPKEAPKKVQKPREFAIKRPSDPATDISTRPSSPPEEPPIKAQKRHETARKRPAFPAAEASSHLFPLLISGPPTLPKLAATTESIVNQESQDSRTIAGKPASTLRIKARAPRKMMFMQRSLSRSSARSDSSGNSHAPSKRQHAPQDAQNIIMSQPTKDLDSFHEQHQRRLEERMNERAPEVDLDEFSSSPMDSGINHQMIDAFLSRKTKVAEEDTCHRSVGKPPPKSAAKTVSEEDPEEAKARSTEKLNSPKRPTRKLAFQHETPYISSEPPPPSPHVSLDTEEPSGLKRDESMNVQPGSTSPNADAMVNSIVCQVGASIAHPPSERHWEVVISADGNGQQSEPLNQEDVGSNTLSSSPAHTPSAYTTNIERGSTDTTTGDVFLAESSPNENVSGVASQDGLSNKNTSRSAKELVPAPEAEPVEPIAPKSQTTALNAPMSGAIMSASAHFRAMLKSSASPSNQVMQDLAPVHSEQATVPLSLVPAGQKTEPDSSELAIKASPAPSAALKQVLAGELQPNNGSPAAAVENIEVPTTNPRRAQPKPKLANPATRGPSVKVMASRTVNALDPAFNGLPSMAPPQPHITTRPGEDPAHEEALSDRAVGERAKEATGNGPWGRESFDLFGSWRPPTGPNAVKASN